MNRFSELLRSSIVSATFFREKKVCSYAVLMPLLPVNAADKYQQRKYFDNQLSEIENTLSVKRIQQHPTS